MSIIAETRLSDSPYVATITHGHTATDGSSIRPAEYHWHMVFVKEHGRFHPLVVGPLPAAGITTYGANAEILWVKFNPGTFMPHMPARKLINQETLLPEAGIKKFWLKGAAWQFPDAENVETFINRLMREEVLVYDPVITATLKDQPQDISLRTLRDRFLRTTGLAQNQIRQIERAQRAAALLEQGFSILDTVYEVGYYDQPHLTRALKQWVGYTPAQILARNK